VLDDIDLPAGVFGLNLRDDRLSGVGDAGAVAGLGHRGREPAVGHLVQAHPARSGAVTPWAWYHQRGSSWMSFPAC
jgi:hypothetical protein